MKIKGGFRLRTIMGQPTVIGEGVEQVDFNKLITLNSTAAYLWENVLDKDFDASTLSALLVKKYLIDEQTAITDAERLLAQWVEIGLVE